MADAPEAGYAAAQLAAVTLVATFTLQAMDRLIRRWKASAGLPGSATRMHGRHAC